jgi:hypothetical protein
VGGCGGDWGQRLLNDGPPVVWVLDGLDEVPVGPLLEFLVDLVCGSPASVWADRPRDAIILTSRNDCMQLDGVLRPLQRWELRPWTTEEVKKIMGPPRSSTHATLNSKFVCLNYGANWFSFDNNILTCMHVGKEFLGCMACLTGRCPEDIE